MINVLLIVGAILSMIYGLIATMTAFQSPPKIANAHVAAEIITYSIETHFKDDGAWLQTFNDRSNSNLACLSTGGCPSLPTAPDGTVADKDKFKLTSLLNSSGSVIVSSSPNDGFTWDGSPCSTFNVITPDGLCPFRVDIIWMPDPVAAAAGGPIPTIFLKAKITISVPREMVPTFNAAAYDFEVVRTTLQ